MTHPRLFLRGSDLPRLQAWAVPGNPIYQSGLSALVTSAVADMDAGLIMTPDNGGQTYVSYPAEMYAELFAFKSLLSTDQPTKDAFAQRARTLLMYVINQAALGEAAGQPYRDPEFATSDRSRWQGEGFPLTVDWIYSYLTLADKATIRQVFLRWINDNLNATITDYNHPVPIGMVNSPVLVQNLQAVRFSGNNYFSAHMRNIGLMAASFDPADDPGNTLRNFVGNATGAWLYIFDNLMRNSAAGGLMPEGFEYGPQTVAYAAQLLLALKTAGLDDSATYGPQVVLTGNPFWDQLLPAYLNSLSPAASGNQDVGQAYLPASYGDEQNYYAPDYIAPLATLAIYDRITGNTLRPQQIRWIETNLAPGGASGLTGRARDSNFFSNAILYFLLFDPTASAPSDPRPSFDTSWFASGLGRILARTGWDTGAAWFTYKLSFNQVDHQTGDGNQFEFYRSGEWLTKERSGYDLDSESSLDHNTLALQNNQPQRDPGDYRTIEWQLGSQWAYVSSGDPAIVARSLSQNFVYATGDATNLYNSTNENATDILYASRSVMWIKPDYIVAYDRAASITANRFKRFWLNLPTLPAIAGNVATMTTAAGQSLFVTSLLPAVSTITAEQSTIVGGDVANFEPMGFRLRVEATGGPASTRFLHVLQGADAGQAASAAVLLRSTSGTAFDGVAVAGNAVLFAVNLSDTFTTTAYVAPATATLHRVTGLLPGAGYSVSIQTAGPNVQVSIATGGNTMADAGGVLEFSTVNPGSSAVVVNSGGIVNNAGYKSPVSPGSLIAIFGSNLATASSLSFPFPLPTLWSGTSVTINGTAAPLLYVTPSQIGVQVPPNASLGTATLIVTANRTSATGTVTITSAAPGLFADSSGRAAAQHGNGSAVTPSNPANGGEEIVLYGSGQGPLTITPPLGSAAGSGSLCVDSVTVTINDANSTVDFCGLASGFVGLTQINVTVPSGLSAGDVPVVATINGVASAPAVVAVSGQ